MALVNHSDQLSNPGVYSRLTSPMTQIEESSKEVYGKYNITVKASNQHRPHFEIFQMKIHPLQIVQTTGYFYKEKKKKKNLDPYFTPNPQFNTKCIIHERAKTTFLEGNKGEKSLGNRIR